MSGTIHDFPTPSEVAQPAVPIVVEILEDLLRRAKEGQIIGLAVAATVTGRATATVYDLGEGDAPGLHYALSRLTQMVLEYGMDE